MIRSCIHAIEEIQSERSIALLADLAKGSSQALKEKAIESLEILKERGSDAARKQLNRLHGKASPSKGEDIFGEVPPPPPNLHNPEPEPAPEIAHSPREAERSIPLPALKSQPEPELEPEFESEPEHESEMRAPPPRIQPPPGPKPDAPRSKPKAKGDPAMAMPDFSNGFSAVAVKAWFDSLPPKWRVATLATLMVWGMVLLMFFAESMGRGDDF